MNLIIAIILVVVFSWILIQIGTLLFVLKHANSSKLDELRYLQGSSKNVVDGQLANPPSTGDFRVSRGLEWSQGGYVAQSRLSVEAIKSTFFAR